MSLLKAAERAFSKFKLFPVSNSALNSFSIDCSKLSKLSAAASSLDISIPVALTLANISPTAPAFPLNSNN